MAHGPHARRHAVAARARRAAARHHHRARIALLPARRRAVAPRRYRRDPAHPACARRRVLRRRQLLYQGASFGRLLWTTDGTTDGMLALEELPPAEFRYRRYDDEPRDFTPAGNVMFFSVAAGDSGRELWALPLGALPEVCVDDCPWMTPAPAPSATAVPPTSAPATPTPTSPPPATRAHGDGCQTGDTSTAAAWPPLAALALLAARRQPGSYPLRGPCSRPAPHPRPRARGHRPARARLRLRPPASGRAARVGRLRTGANAGGSPAAGLPWFWPRASVSPRCSHRGPPGRRATPTDASATATRPVRWRSVSSSSA